MSVTSKVALDLCALRVLRGETLGSVRALALCLAYPLETTKSHFLLLTEDVGLAVPGYGVVFKISVMNVASDVDSLLVPGDCASGNNEVLRPLALDPEALVVLHHAVFDLHRLDISPRADDVNPHPFVFLNEAVAYRDCVQHLAIDLDSVPT